MFCLTSVAGGREPRSAFELLCVGSQLCLSFILRAAAEEEFEIPSIRFESAEAWGIIGNRIWRSADEVEMVEAPETT